MEEAEIKWIDCDLGSPADDEVSGRGVERAQIARRGDQHRPGGDGQHQDTGAKMTHAAEATTSNIVSREYQCRQRARDLSRLSACPETPEKL